MYCSKTVPIHGPLLLGDEHHTFVACGLPAVAVNVADGHSFYRCRVHLRQHEQSNWSDLLRFSPIRKEQS